MRVEVYTQPGCLPCMATIRELKKQGIPHEIRDAQEYRGFLQALGHTTTPVVIVYKPDGALITSWSGHRPHKIHALTSKDAA